MIDDTDKHWHLSKSIPIGLVMFLVAQTIALIIWAVKLDSRVEALEKIAATNIQRLSVIEAIGPRIQSLEATDVSHTNRISALEVARDKIILIEERQNNVIRQLDANSKKLDILLEESRAKR